MRAYRFVVGPEKLKVPYEPFSDFAEGIKTAAIWFLEQHGECPNACYVSVGFPDALPGAQLVRGGPEGLGALRFCRQTLLGQDEVLLGVEVEIDLWEGGDDERFDERAIG